MWELPCPFTEGKTACGQVEMLQLYHRISVVPKGFPPRKQPSDFRRQSDPHQRRKQVAHINHIRLHIPKSPAHPWPISGSVAAISLLIVLARASGGRDGVPDLSRGNARGRQHRASGPRSLCLRALDGALTLHPARSSGHLNRTIGHVIRRPRSPRSRTRNWRRAKRR